MCILGTARWRSLFERISLKNAVSGQHLGPWVYVLCFWRGSLWSLASVRNLWECVFFVLSSGVRKNAAQGSIVLERVCMVLEKGWLRTFSSWAPYLCNNHQKPGHRASVSQSREIAAETGIAGGENG